VASLQPGPKRERRGGLKKKGEQREEKKFSSTLFHRGKEREKVGIATTLRKKGGGRGTRTFSPLLL